MSPSCETLDPSPAPPDEPGMSSRLLLGVRDRVHLLWLRFHAWADGVAIKWKIFGIAVIGGVMTALVMTLSLFSIWQIGNSSDREFAAVRARDEVVAARLRFDEVRTQLFRLAGEPSIGTTPVEQAIAELGQAG